METIRIIFQNSSFYFRGFCGLMVSLPLIVKTIYVWGQIMRDRQYKDVLEKMKQIAEMNKEIK